MKPDTDIYRTALGSKDTHAAACFADESKVSGVFDRHFFVEIEQAAVDVNERMDLRSVCEIELQADRRDSGAVSSLAMKCIDTRGTGGARNDHARRDRDWHRVNRVLQCE